MLGKTFTKRALAALSSLGEAELEPLLVSLLHKEVLVIQADPRSPEHGQYSFLQDLVRHVAYETLSKKERRSRHLAAAAHLEAAFPEEDEIVEVVASHYLDAYRADPDTADATRSGRGPGDARACGRARVVACRRPRGQRYFEQAAELTDDAVVRADCRTGQLGWPGDEAGGLKHERCSSRRCRRQRRPASATRPRECPRAWPRSTSERDTPHKRSPAWR